MNKEGRTTAEELSIQPPIRQLEGERGGKKKEIEVHRMTERGK